MLSIRYMGSKKHLARAIAQELLQFDDGYCVDLFSGMCYVASALANRRPVIANDVAYYAYFVATTILKSPSDPPDEDVIETLRPYYEENCTYLLHRFGHYVQTEREWFLQHESNNWIQYKQWSESIPYIANDANLENEARQLQCNPSCRPYRLFTITFANSYFGFHQCLQIDSFRFAVDHAYREEQITSWDRSWLLIAGMQALSHISASPGHFAEYLRVQSAESFMSILKLRNRDYWDQLRIEIQRLRPVGDPSWRERNIVLHSDALAAASSLRTIDKIACVYADPPYSSAQYSRYYHVFDTFLRYDYPLVASNGRYRMDRYKAPFCRKSEVTRAFEYLIRMVADLRLPLVLSYPSSGLLFQAGGDLWAMLRNYFKSVEVRVLEHKHSTLGSRSGMAQRPVKEFLFIAR